MIAAAGLIMISVFGSFIINGDPVIKQFGVGLADGRCCWPQSMTLLLAPAVLVLLGRALWWLPGPVGGLLPDLGLDEGGGDEAPAMLPVRQPLAQPAMADEGGRRPRATRPGRRHEPGHRGLAVAAGRGHSENASRRR